MNLPLNTQLYDSIKKIFTGEMDLNKDEVVLQAIEWSNYLDAKNSPRLLYSLQIINNLVSCAILDEKDPEVSEKSHWRINFLEMGGLAYIFNLFLSFPINSITKQLKSSEVGHNTEAKLLNILLNILRTYSHTSLIASSSEPRQKLLVEALGLNLFDNKKASSEKDTTSQQPSQPPSGPESVPGATNDSFFSAQTPTFATPEASNSTTPIS